MKSTKVLFTCILIFVFSIVSMSVMAADKAPVVIGLQAPITGAAAVEGEMAKQSVEIAAQMINEKGGILGGRMIEIRIADDACQPKAGALAAMKLISQKDIVAAIQSYGSSVTQPGSDIYENLKSKYCLWGNSYRTYRKRFKIFLPYLWQNRYSGRIFCK